MARRRFTDKDRARIFAANNGCCHLCGEKIDGVREAWEIEHVIPWALTRDDSDANLRPAHKKCHRDVKTKQDVKDIAEAKRREARHTGVKRATSKLSKQARPVAEKRPSKPPVANNSQLFRMSEAGKVAQP